MNRVTKQLSNMVMKQATKPEEGTTTTPNTLSPIPGITSFNNGHTYSSTFNLGSNTPPLAAFPLSRNLTQMNAQEGAPIDASPIRVGATFSSVVQSRLLYKQKLFGNTPADNSK